MLGLEFICKVFDMQYKEVAEKIGVSNQTITDWIKGKTPKIPEKRINDLVTKVPEFSRINKELFSKELAPSDKQKITTLYLIDEVEKQLRISMENRDVKGLKEALHSGMNATSGLRTSINLDSLLLITEHLIDNKEFMNDLDKLIIKYKPSLEKFMK